MFRCIFTKCIAQLHPIRYVGLLDSIIRSWKVRAKYPQSLSSYLIRYVDRHFNHPNLIPIYSFIMSKLLSAIATWANTCRLSFKIWITCYKLQWCGANSSNFSRITALVWKYVKQIKFSHIAIFPTTQQTNKQWLSIILFSSVNSDKKDLKCELLWARCVSWQQIKFHKFDKLRKK